MGEEAEVEKFKVQEFKSSRVEAEAKPKTHPFKPRVGHPAPAALQMWF
jgi:hypothetical protein